MALPTSRSTRNQEHALSLAYALRGVLDTKNHRYVSLAQLEAVEEAQKALLAFKADNPSFSL